MTISPLALAAKKVIDAAWLHGDAYDLSSQAAFALESAQLLQSPETAAELHHLRAQRKAVPYVLGESKVPEDLREQLVALLTEILRQGVPGPALTGGMHATGEMEAALSGAFARKMYPAPGLFPSAAEEVHRLRARVAELEAAPSTVFRASHDSINLGRYRNKDAARLHCDTLMLREKPAAVLDWIEDEEDGIDELVATVGGKEIVTGYVVTALDVDSEYDGEADE